MSRPDESALYALLATACFVLCVAFVIGCAVML